MSRDLRALVFGLVFLIGVGGQFGIFWALILGGLGGIGIVVADAFLKGPGK